MMKRILSLITVLLIIVASLTGCSGSDKGSTATSGSSTETKKTSTGEKALNMGVSFWYEMDAHTDYNGWYTSMYGLTETLFKVADDYSIEPWIAESGTCEGNTWTIKLKDNVVFSNGNPVTSEIVIKNLQRAGEVNERAIVFKTAKYDVIDDTSFTITTTEAYPTMLNDLTDPYTSILDLDNITNDDFNKGIIATGPFKIVSYTNEDNIQFVKNDKYWNGDVNLDKVTIYYIPDAATEAMSLQSGEIDMYVGPDADSIATFSADSNYTVASTPQGRAYMYMFNLERLKDSNVRKAILMSVNKDDICTLLSGTASPAVGAFSSESAYGKVTGNAFDPEGAAKLLTDSGYTKNADGFYEKDGKVLTVTVGYYAARSIDKISTLIQDELKAVGIQADLKQYEDPDSTYMTTGEFDMGMYFVTTTSTGDPYAFLNSVMATKGNLNYGHYSNQKVDADLMTMATEADAAKRATLANEIQQLAIDDAAYGFIAIPNKVTVMKAGVTGCAEKNPIAIYAISAETNKE